MIQRVADINRFAKDGDEFHYHWGARQCLELLAFSTKLHAISVEGPSPLEAKTAAQRGEQIIDIGLYYGSDDPAKASALKYAQLKHSTVRAKVPWTVSELKPTLHAFGSRYRNISSLREHSSEASTQFAFVSNRPVPAEVHLAREQIASGLNSSRSTRLASFASATGLHGRELQQFCASLRFQDEEEGFLSQRLSLTQELRDYVGEEDEDAAMRLANLVRRKATSEFSSNLIRRQDVLRSLDVQHERDIFPAPNLIETPPSLIRRDAERKLAEKIVEAGTQAVLVEGDGGTGKSVFAMTLGEQLPAGSRTIIYDCFANGEYRRVSSPRHRARDGLVQIANELAAAKLGMPFLPRASLDRTGLVRAFLKRLSDAAAVLRSSDPAALLCIVIDAADNSEEAARDSGDGHSFAYDLIREELPPGARLVLTSRPYRVHLLAPPSTVRRLTLEGFTRSETAINLRTRHPEASENDVEEFHRLTSRNPRLQDKVLSSQESLSAVFAALGPNPGSVEDAIEGLLDRAIARLKDRAGGIESAHIDLMCEALAALRPLVPSDIVAKVAGVEREAVTSFALDLDGAVLVRDGWLQFHDEPTETWFRKRYRPSAVRIGEFALRLEPLAAHNAYAASCLPQLLLEAGRHEELVALALSSRSLPSSSPLERRDVELQRLIFAFRASLRGRRTADAAKIALKAGGETAAAERQQKLLQENADIAASLMDPQLLLELVERRAFGGNWFGAHYAHESLLLSAHMVTQGEANSRLRLARGWLRNWSQLPKPERSKERIEDADLVAMALAHLNLRGAKEASDFMAGWSPKSVPFRLGRGVTRSLLDQHRLEDALSLLAASTERATLALGIVVELVNQGHLPPRESCLVVVRDIERLLEKISDSARWTRGEEEEKSFFAIVMVSLGHRLKPFDALTKLLTRHLNDDALRIGIRRHTSVKTLMQLAGLRAALAGLNLQVRDLAHETLREELDKLQPSSHPRENLREFLEVVEPILPWVNLWSDWVISGPGRNRLQDQLAASIAKLPAETPWQPRARSLIFDDVGDIWLDLLIRTNDAEGFAELFQRLEPLATGAFWLRAAYRCARSSGFAAFAYPCSSKARSLDEERHVDAEYRASSSIGYARAIHPIDLEEAKRALDRSVELVGGIGSENLSRWDAILTLAEQSAVPGQRQPELAYRLGRGAELIWHYLDREKHFDAARSVEAVAHLCPSSAMAMMSRWASRGVSAQYRYLDDVVLMLAREGHIEGAAVLCFAPFDHLSLPFEEVLRLACRTGAQPDHQRFLDLLVRYLSLQLGSEAEWNRLREVGVQLGLTVSGLEAAAAGAQEPPPRGRVSTVDVDEKAIGSPTQPVPWAEIFYECDLAQSEGIRQAYNRYRALAKSYELDEWIRKTVVKVTADRVVPFLRAFGRVESFRHWELRALLSLIPESWLERDAVRSELRILVETRVRTDPTILRIHKEWQPLPIDLAARVSNVPASHFIGVALASLGDRDESLSTQTLFSAAALAALTLQPAEAQDVLSFGLGLLEAQMTPSDGDGPWRTDLRPPEPMSAALAGFLGAMLASPHATERWRAAHAVRILCFVDARNVLTELADFVGRGKGDCFVDARFIFYQMHAKQWFIFGLLASACESPAVVGSFASFLLKAALNEDPHVIVRAAASQALLLLHRSGHCRLTRTEIRDLATLNHPTGYSKKSTVRRGESWQQERPDRRFLFGYDMDRYWYEPLGDKFGISTGDVERIAEVFILDRWGFACGGKWDEDVRGRLNLYGERGNWHSHSSYPRHDDLSFYLSYHALMCAAGQLVDSRPLRASEAEFESWLDWLHRHWLTRRDGLWLFDRRDPVPHDLRLSRAEDSEGEEDGLAWAAAIWPSRARHLLKVDCGRVTVGGWWESKASPRGETVSIASALVTGASAMALLRSLQTSSETFGHQLPDDDGSQEIDAPGYRLRGWIFNHSADSRIDGVDRWSGSIKFPVPRPSEKIQCALKLTSDHESRVWKHRGKLAIETEVWGTSQEREDEDRGVGGNAGWRMRATTAFLQEMLSRTESSLIIEVSIRREWEHSYSRRTYSDDDLRVRYAPNVFYFLLEADGKIRSFR